MINYRKIMIFLLSASLCMGLSGCGSSTAGTSQVIETEVIQENIEITQAIGEDSEKNTNVSSDSDGEAVELDKDAYMDTNKSVEERVQALLLLIPLTMVWSVKDMRQW